MDIDRCPSFKANPQGLRRGRPFILLLQHLSPWQSSPCLQYPGSSLTPASPKAKIKTFLNSMQEGWYINETNTSSKISVYSWKICSCYMGSFNTGSILVRYTSLLNIWFSFKMALKIPMFWHQAKWCFKFRSAPVHSGIPKLLITDIYSAYWLRAS